MPLTHFAAAALALVVALQSSSVPWPSFEHARGMPPLAQADTIHHRAAEITLTIANSKTYGGTYTARGVSRVCGNSMIFMNGLKDGFNFEFPYEGDFEIVDVNFASDTLKVGVPTKSYYIDLGLKTKDGGRPSGWILRTNQPKYGETGTVLLTAKGNVATLKITGQNKQGETLDMTVVCRGVVP